MPKPDNPRRALGKGLGALLPTRNPNQPPTPAPNPLGGAPLTAIPSAAEPQDPVSVSPALIDPNPLQPRRMFDDAKMEELAQSIRANGIIQPLVVKRNGSRYQLIAGERRLRAAKLAGVPAVPIVIRQ